MSAEREVFKQMASLHQGKLSQDIEYLVSGRNLVKTALKEFFVDHPEVGGLSWCQDTTDDDDFCISHFRIEKGHLSFYAHSTKLEAIDPKLAKCLIALAENFILLKEVLRDMFGTTDPSFNSIKAKNL